MYCWKITCFFCYFQRMFFIYICNRQQKKEAKNAENALGGRQFLSAIFFQKKNIIRIENLASVSLKCKITNQSQLIRLATVFTERSFL